jgi:acyl carrier protein
MTTYSPDELKKTIFDFINEEFLYDKQHITLTDDLNIIEQGILDSMDIFRLIQFIEETVKIGFEPEEMIQTNFQSVNDIVNFVQTKKI